jgi:hypothetical protein
MAMVGVEFFKLAMSRLDSALYFCLFLVCIAAARYWRLQDSKINVALTAKQAHFNWAKDGELLLIVGHGPAASTPIPAK